MKLRRWLSRGLVLALTVAMLVPMPVAAKSSSGGKLVKSVTYYEYQQSGRWQAESKTAYTYDKKNNPSEIARINYTSHLLSVPVSGTKTVTTAKFKYKGSTPKSAKFKDGAGKVTQTRKYTKGRVTKITSANSTSYEYYNDDDVYAGDNVTSTSSTSTIAYNKKGLATASSYTYGESATYATGNSSSETNTSNSTYAITHKKGIPSLIIENYSYNYADSDGNTDTYSGTYYDKFNSKGLVIERGRITDAGVYVPNRIIQYTTKKGVVKQAVVYAVTADSTTGAITKQTPKYMYKFKYAKTKISAVRYLSEVNSFIGTNAFFAWY